MLKNRTVTRATGGMTLALLMAAAAGCARHGEAGPGGSEAGDAPTLRFVYPLHQKLYRTVEQPARVEAFEQTPMHVKITGYVDQVHVEIGSRVKKGDPLADLWVPEMEIERDQKQKLVRQAVLDIEVADKGLEVARANVAATAALVDEANAGRKEAEGSYAFWQSEAERMKGYARDKLITTQSKDEVLRQLNAAEAGKEKAEARVKSATAAHNESVARQAKAEADAAAARNRKELAEKDLEHVETMLGYARVTAPFDGVVSERNVDTRHFLQPAAGGRPPFVVVRVDKVRVFLEVPETDAVLIQYGRRWFKGGCTAHIRVPVLNDREFTGQVVGSSWRLEPGQRTLRTEIDFDNPDGSLRPGMYAQAVINVEQPDAWTLPSGAVITRDGQTFCYCLEEGKAVRTVLKIGFKQGALIQVLKKQTRPSKPGEEPRWVDFTGAEVVLTEKVGELTDGQEVVRGASDEVPKAR